MVFQSYLVGVYWMLKAYRVCLSCPPPAAEYALAIKCQFWQPTFKCWLRKWCIGRGTTTRWLPYSLGCNELQLIGKKKCGRLPDTDLTHIVFGTPYMNMVQKSECPSVLLLYLLRWPGPRFLLVCHYTRDNRLHFRKWKVLLSVFSEPKTTFLRRAITNAKCFCPQAHAFNPWITALSKYSLYFCFRHESPSFIFLPKTWC